MIAHLLLILMVSISVKALQCYDSTYPTPHRFVTCPSEGMLCYSEYYAVNRSGTIREYFDRFCVNEQHCSSRGIRGCKELGDLSPKVQRAFVKYHARSVGSEIPASNFCCCDSDLCNKGPTSRLKSASLISIFPPTILLCLLSV